MRFLLHESIHNTTPFRPKDYSKPGNKVIEELTTEISARIVARDLFGGGSFAKTSLGQPYIEIFEPKPGLKVSKWLDRSTSYSYLVEAVAEILQKETGWDEARVQLEIDAASLAVRSVPQDAPIPADAVKFFVSKTTATAEQKSKIAEAIQEFSKIEEP